jgi:hypothetical protein
MPAKLRSNYGLVLRRSNFGGEIIAPTVGNTTESPRTPMLQIDFKAQASVTWQHPPYCATAVEAFVDDFNLGEAVRFVMEQLSPQHRVQAKINAGGNEYRLADIDELYCWADFLPG